MLLNQLVSVWKANQVAYVSVWDYDMLQSLLMTLTHGNTL